LTTDSVAAAADDDDDDDETTLTVVFSSKLYLIAYFQSYPFRIDEAG